MIGGTKLIISGPCLNLTKAISLLMSDGKDVPCQKFNQFSVSCISPPVYRTGKEIVVLRLTQASSNQTLQFAGVLKIGNLQFHFICYVYLSFSLITKRVFNDLNGLINPRTVEFSYNLFNH